MTFQNKKPLVSIGIPTYNRAKFLKIAIDSALSQDYKNIEILVSDNNSSDETESLCLNYLKFHKNIKYCRSNINKGPIENFKNALKCSVGEYFMWLADDDFLDKNYISTCLNRLMENRNLVIVGGISRTFGSSKEGIGRYFNLEQQKPLCRILAYYWNPIDNSIYYGLMLSKHAKLSSIHNVLGSDWIFVAAMAYQGSLITLKETAINRRAGGASSSLKNIVKSLGISNLNIIFPGISLAINCAADVYCRNPIYKELTIFKRLIYTASIFILIVLRHGLYQTFRKAIYHFLIFIVGDRRYNLYKKYLKNK